jgi:hypothetical protein
MCLSKGAFALTIEFMVGDVSVIRGGSKISLSIGTAIHESDKVITGKKAVVTMNYADGSQISMKENAVLVIGKMPEGSDSAPVCVVSGSVTTKFSKLAKGSDARRSVYTPTAVAAVRGTEFTVQVSDGGDSRIDLTEGSLDVHNPYGGQQIAAGQNLEAEVAKAPADAAGAPDQWKADKDTAMAADAAQKGKAYDAYMNDFSSRGKKSSSSIDGISKKVKGSKDAKALDSTGKELDGIAGPVEEDFYLSATAGAAIEGITDRFKEDKTGIHDKFLKLKEESNKVKEQLRRNYEAIQAVRESYKKAKEEIINRKNEDTKKIKEGVNFQNVKPKIEKKGAEEK